MGGVVEDQGLDRFYVDLGIRKGQNMTVGTDRRSWDLKAREREKGSALGM